MNEELRIMNPGNARLFLVIHSSLFTLHSSLSIVLHYSLFILHYSLFTLHLQKQSYTPRSRSCRHLRTYEDLRRNLRTFEDISKKNAAAHGSPRNLTISSTSDFRKNLRFFW